MKKVSKILCLLLSVVMLVSSLSAVSFSAYAASVGKVTGVVSHTYDTKSITLTWKKVKNASGYKVYKYNSKSKKYKAVATVSKNKAKITKLSPNKTYKFKVRAYKTKGKKKSYGAYSNVYKKSTSVDVKKILTAGYVYCPSFCSFDMDEYKFNNDGTYICYSYYDLTYPEKYDKSKGTYKIKKGTVTLDNGMAFRYDKKEKCFWTLKDKYTGLTIPLYPESKRVNKNNRVKYFNTHHI